MSKKSHKDFGFIKSVVEDFATEQPETDILKWIESRRVMPPGSPFPGQFTNELTPYFCDIYDWLSPVNPIQHVVILKGVQIGATTLAENLIAFYVGAVPSETLYVSGTKSLLENFSKRRLDPLLQSCDLARLLSPSTENEKSRSSGSTTMLKEFPGGSLALASAQSASQLRMASKRILIRDEIDSAPIELRNDEGNWLDVSYKRTTAFGNRRKILDLSTPVGYDQSSIQKLYEQGDQCHFQIPCLKCGTFQEITFSKLIPIYDNNNDLKEIYFPCESCGHQHYNQDKVSFNKLGKWVPTAVSKSETMKSCYLSGLYSPPGMLSWDEMRKEYDAAQQDDSGEKMKTFVTLSLGKAYRDITTKPRLQSVTRLRNNYKERTIPSGVLYLTVGIDVQTSEKDPRLELEVLGVGDQWRTWSIDYRVVHGDVRDPTGGAWSALVQGVSSGQWFTFKRADGVIFEPMMIFVDTGDGNISDVIYKFIDGYQWKKTHAIKGFGTIRTTTHKMIRYRPHASGRFIEINTNHYKKTIYRNLENSYRSFKQEDDIQDIGFCHFPAEYPEKYFEMLTSEDARADGTFYCPHGKRNEALDCRVYSLCASDFFLDQYVKRLQADLRTKGFPENKILEREHKFVLRHFATTTGQVYPYRPEDLTEYLASKKRAS